MAWRRTGLQAIIGTNADPSHWRIYAALGGDELTYRGWDILQMTFLDTFYYIKILDCGSVFIESYSQESN